MSSNVQPGDTVVARVTRIEPYGIYADFRGTEILVLVPDLDWGPSDPRAFGPLGTERKIQIVETLADGRVKGSIKALDPARDPWRDPTIYAPGRSAAGIVAYVFPAATVVILDTGAAATVPPDLSQQFALQQGERRLFEVTTSDPTSRTLVLRPS